ncbi:MAG: hypothetical protein FWG50_12590 [Kiritimatiellaeota bacterium]|nr:hypothetical protein [Kiritimatiellota bacterium]
MSEQETLRQSPMVERMQEIIRRDREKRGMTHMHVFHNASPLASDAHFASQFVYAHEGDTENKPAGTLGVFY